MKALDQYSIEELETAISRKLRKANKAQENLHKSRNEDLDKVQKFISGWGWNISESLEIPDVKVKCGGEILTIEVNTIDDLNFILVGSTKKTLMGKVLSDFLIDETPEGMESYLPKKIVHNIQNKLDKLAKFLDALPNGKWIESTIIFN